MAKSERAKEKLITFKIYFDRARMYLGYINFFILNLVLINSIDNPMLSEFIADNKWILLPALLILYVVLLLFIGYLDTKLGLRQEELRNNAVVNPIMQDLMRTVYDIQEKVTAKENDRIE